MAVHPVLTSESVRHHCVLVRPPSRPNRLLPEPVDLYHSCAGFWRGPVQTQCLEREIWCRGGKLCHSGAPCSRERVRAPTPYTLHPAPCILHPAPFTPNPSPHTLHPVPCTLHPTPCTLHPTPSTLHPATPHTPHPTPYTLHPTPYMLHVGQTR